MHGQFFWYDLMTSDTAAAAAFYGGVVGWGAQESGHGDYKLFTADGRPVTGLMPIPDELQGPARHPVWMGYVAVDDVDAAAARIQKLGGKLHRPPFEVPDVIRFAVVADPQGAVFLVAKGLVENAPPLPANDMPGAIGWRELYASDWTEVFGFYETMFGWTKDQAIDMGPMGTYQLFATGSHAVGGMMTKPPMIPMPYWGYYFNVPAIDAAVDRVKSGGGKVYNEPMQVPGGSWIVNCEDPQGAYFSLAAPSR